MWKKLFTNPKTYAIENYKTRRNRLNSQSREDELERDFVRNNDGREKRLHTQVTKTDRNKILRDIENMRKEELREQGKYSNPIDHLNEKIWRAEHTEPNFKGPKSLGYGYVKGNDNTYTPYYENPLDEPDRPSIFEGRDSRDSDDLRSSFNSEFRAGRLRRHRRNNHKSRKCNKSKCNKSNRRRK